MKKASLKHWHRITLCLIIFDILAVNLSYFLALWFRFDCQYTAIPAKYLHAFLYYVPIHTVVCIAAFGLTKLYSSMWQFASFHELTHVLTANIITAIVHAIGITLLFVRMPISYYVFGFGFQLVLTLAIRFSYRFQLMLRDVHSGKKRDVKTVNVMLIGAGKAGQVIIEEAMRSPESKDRIACVIDDNPNKWGRYIAGVKIVGGRDDILMNCQKYEIEKILFAIPSASPETKRDILNICKEAGCELRALPALYQLANGSVTIADMKPVDIEDLLGRPPIQVDMEDVFRSINGKTVLVTGGGGSIGSELCRQVASHSPKRLIIFDVYENNAYDIQLELKKKYPDLDLLTLIGSVRDSRKMFQLFEQYRPDIVYHAAAHKHVPLMEDSPCESIKNNVIGTYKTAYAAMAHGTKRFVLISTDKAVNPTNIMGASKRLCEMVIQSFADKIAQGKAEEIPQLFTHAKSDYNNPEVLQQIRNARTEFVAVRFGNVLGSNGSVIPLFRKQIAAGGPVTVTHKDIIRYFMTIPEATRLVMLAGTYAKGGEIFVLDMGEPVKIDTLARNLIKLSGFKPDVDIKIEYTGLRPGEKLYEEKLMAEEGLKRTDNDLIHIGCPIPFDTNEFLQQLAQLMDIAYKNKDGEIREYVQKVVSTYHPAANSVTKA